MQPVIVMNWNLAEQLPETAGCRNSFNAIIAGYINAVYTQLKQTEMNDGPIIALTQPSLGLGAHEKVAEFAKEIISGELSQNLFR